MGQAATESEEAASSPKLKAAPARSLRERLADRKKWPRKWWWPLREELNLSDESWKKQHDEISKAINKLLLVLIGFCFFCALALGAPDRSLLANDAKIKLPFADTEISFVAFLIVAPLVLTALSFYVHIFAGYWINLTRQGANPSNSEPLEPALPFVFNLKYRTATWLSNFLFYWLVPLTLAVFAWKALPRPEAPKLIALTSFFISVFLFLYVRRLPDNTRRIFTYILWLMFVGAIFVDVLAFSALDSGKILIHRRLNLRKADLSKQDLRFVNLQAADLSEANLEGARLDGANLLSADLLSADLHRADLSGAYLHGANLSGANLTGARLARANLSGANLFGANLSGAYLSGADLTGANLSGANLSGADLVTPEQVDISRSSSLPFLPPMETIVGQGQVDSADGDEHTKLPPGIVMPNAWRKNSRSH
jgi:hypothetical protein